MIIGEPLASFSLNSQVLIWQAIFLTVLSFGVGILGGAVGLALGTMRLPFLLLLGMPAPVAAGTNILVSTLSAITGAYKHFREGRVDMYIVAVQGIPAMAGAFIGGFFSGRVPDVFLVAVAGILVIWQGVELLLRARQEQQPAAANSPIHSTKGVGQSSDPGPKAITGLARWTGRQIALEGVVGIAIGLLGGAVGLILGSLRLPALIKILNVNPRVAAGSNLVIGFLMGSFGWVGHVAQGQVDYPIIVLMAATGMAGTYYGARLTGTLSLRNLFILMGLVLLVVGALLLWDSYLRIGV